MQFPVVHLLFEKVPHITIGIEVAQARVFEAFAPWRFFRLTAPSNLIVRSFKSTLVERCPINFKFSGLLALFQKHFFLRYLEQTVLRTAATPPVVAPASASSPFLRLECGPPPKPA
jgi:hypothetical protein